MNRWKTLLLEAIGLGLLVAMGVVPLTLWLAPANAAVGNYTLMIGDSR